MKLGNHVVSPLQYPIQRPTMHHQTLSVRRRNQRLDEFIDGGGADTGQILASGPFGRFRGPEVPLLVSRRSGLTPGVDDHVEIEAVHAATVLRGVDGAHPGIDANPL